MTETGYARSANTGSIGALEAASARFDALKAKMTSSSLADQSESEVETLIVSEGREALRLLLQGHIEWRMLAHVDDPVVGSDGVQRTACRADARRALETTLGTVAVVRPSFEVVGHESLRPHDASLGLPEDRYSYPVRRTVVASAIDVSYDAAAEALLRNTGAAVAKRQVEALIQRASVDFDAFYVNTVMPVPSERTAEILVLTCDQKGIVMRHDALREPTREAAKQAVHKLATRLSKGEKRNRKRMASVAAVYTVAPYVRTAEDVVRGLASLRPVDSPEQRAARPRPQCKRVWASIEKSHAEVIDAAFAEAAARDPERKKTWVVLVDGDRKQLRRVADAARRFGVTPTILADFIHVLEYLWTASHAFHADGSPEAEAWVLERLLRVLKGDAGLVAGGMRRSATKRGLTTKERKPVDRAAGYITKLAPYLGYADALTRGFPIATGVIEGACRHLIADRFDITGARWSLAGAEALLKLRALRSSGDLDAYWDFHLDREHDRNHASRYAHATVPPLKPPTRRGHLEAVR